MEEEKKVRTELTPEELEKASGGVNNDGLKWCSTCDKYVDLFICADGKTFCGHCKNRVYDWQLR